MTTRPASSAGEPAAKRPRFLEKASPFLSEPVKLRSGEAEHPAELYFHKLKLCTQSPRLQRELADKSCATLEDVSAYTLQSFAVWLYLDEVSVEELDPSTPNDTTSGETPAGPTTFSRKEVVSRQSTAPANRPEQQENGMRRTSQGLRSANPSPEPANLKKEPDLGEDTVPELPRQTIESGGKDLHWIRNAFGADNDPADRIFARLLDLYLFAEAYEIPQLAMKAIIATQRYSWHSNMMGDWRIVQRALGSVSIKDRLVQWMIHSAAYYYTFSADEYQYHPAEFLHHVLALRPCLHVLSEESDTGSNPDHDWCYFHGHDTDEEQEACEQSRESDPDVQHKWRRSEEMVW